MYLLSYYNVGYGTVNVAEVVSVVVERSSAVSSPCAILPPNNKVPLGDCHATCSIRPTELRVWDGSHSPAVKVEQLVSPPSRLVMSTPPQAVNEV